MSILVAYASKYGATRGIAERIAATLVSSGQQAEALPMGAVADLGGWDAFVVGSAIYSTHWLKDAAAFVRHDRDLLAQRPVWLFSSGPLGVEATNAKGQDLRVACEPKELPEFQEAIAPRAHRVFFGALDPDKLSFAERSLRRLPAARAALPEGDFRDWAEIEEWARAIAQALTQMDVTQETRSS